ncbi:hypothetical protein PR202_ga17055 [Eleusine coracana subsp. coracana]|uniref:Uncharacterized protein n=1 Tax=Eleusine coracana subsp. coracana TaxID=191504 RepID=A0AAV5CP73_ELECO|nr:hypothetical protein PR202_ga17055 [Eleusine coracana subsp. coracana]
MYINPGTPPPPLHRIAFHRERRVFTSKAEHPRPPCFHSFLFRSSRLDRLGSSRRRKQQVPDMPPRAALMFVAVLAVLFATSASAQQFMAPSSAPAPAPDTGAAAGPASAAVAGMASALVSLLAASL